MLFFCLQPCGCTVSDADKQAIVDVLDTRKKGIETADIDLYMSTISGRYHDDGGGYDYVKSEAQKSLMAFGGLKVHYLSRNIETDSTKAVATQEFVLIVAGPEPLKITGRDRLRLEKEKSEWKIVGGLYDKRQPATESD